VAEKMDRKQLRQPDALQRAGLEARSWVEEHRGIALAILGAILVIGAGVALADYFGGRSSERAAKALGKALEPASRQVAGPGAPPGEKTFATQEEKDQALVQSLTEFRSEHPGTPAATTAALALADAHYRLGELDPALASYEAFLAAAPKDDSLRALALEGRGYAFEAKGELDRALGAFEELATAESAGVLEGMGRFHRGRLLILKGQLEDAAKALAEIPGAHPNSAAARMAMERMNLLSSQGVKVPAPASPTVSPTADTGS
jgi:tetratricopeptide (TPR) repeat protein